MTDEEATPELDLYASELRKYAAIGIRADVREKANLVEQQLELFKNTMHQASGVYTPARFRSGVESLKTALDAFYAAMEKKEAMNGHDADPAKG